MDKIFSFLQCLLLVVGHLLLAHPKQVECHVCLLDVSGIIELLEINQAELLVSTCIFLLFIPAIFSMSKQKQLPNGTVGGSFLVALWYFNAH